MIVKTYEVYGLVDDAEIFIGSSEMLQVAVLTASNNFGPARYPSVVVYEILREGDNLVAKNVAHRLQKQERQGSVQ